MSMEQRITSVEEVLQLVITALRASNEAMRRSEAVAALRDEAMRQLTQALDRTDAEMRELAIAAERREEAIQALLAFVPLTQTEIVRLDNRVDNIESA